MTISLRKSLQFLIATPKRAILLVPLALVGSYAIGFSLSSGAAMLTGGSVAPKSAAAELPSALQNQLLSLVPAAYAAAFLPEACVTGTCDVLDPASYRTPDFTTDAVNGVDFAFRVPGQPNVGYININSPRQTVTKRFD